jgi:hypothetical protein
MAFADIAAIASGRKTDAACRGTMLEIPANHSSALVEVIGIDPCGEEQR